MNEPREVAEVIKSASWTWRSVVAFVISLAVMNPMGIVVVGLALAMPLMAASLIVTAAREAPRNLAMEQCSETCHGHVTRFSSESGGRRTICECR